MTRSEISRLFGVATALFGCWSICTVWLPQLTPFPDANQEGWEYLFVLTVLALMTLPGVLAAYYGYRLARLANRRHVIGSVAAAIIFGAIWTASYVECLLPLPERIAGSFALLISTTVFIPIYVVLCKLMIASHDRPPHAKGGFLGKRAALVIAFQIWNVSAEILEVYAPVQVSRYPWIRSIHVGGPLVLAWASYKTLAWLFNRGKVELNVGPDGE